jgi:hypothetical protein
LRPAIDQQFAAHRAELKVAADQAIRNVAQGTAFYANNR